jgi:(p)ppGpp synthase/HD superfamily hydrolase
MTSSLASSQMSKVTTRPERGVGSEIATAALRFARRVHLGQHRKQTGEQFVEHPIAVADLLMASGYDGALISAAYLHDVVEKTDIQLDEIRERFGPEIAGLVDDLSEDPEVDGYGARKRALRKRIIESGGDSVVVYAADRVANMRDWRKVAPEDRPACGERLGTSLEERLQLWQEDLEELHELDSDTPFLGEMQSELDALRAEPRV